MVIGIYESESHTKEIFNIITSKHKSNIQFMKLDTLKSATDCNIVIVNVDLVENSKDIDRLMKLRDQALIICILETVKHLTKLIEYEHYHLLTYPIAENKLLQLVYKEIANFQTTLTIKFGGGKDCIKKIPFNDISYITSDKRVIEVVGDDDHGKLGMMYCKLDEIQMQLPDFFIRCHKSYIVNSHKIIKKGNKHLELENVGQTISISRSMKKNVL